MEFDQTLFSKNFLTITLWDKDTFSDDFLGVCMIDINLTPQDGSSIWKTLEPRPGKKDKVQGEIRISLVPGTQTSEDKSVKTKPASSQVKSRIQAAMEEGLTELDLTGCHLNALPSELLEQYQWTTLDIGFNQFSEWPASLSSFKLLTELFVSGNQITSIGDSIGDMVQLKELYLNGNLLVELSDRVSCLTNLEKLDLANNSLRSINPSIGQIVNLEELKLNGNPIKELPKEIGNLSYLLVFDLSFCNLLSLPDSFCNLTRLLELDLGSNNLQSLPTKFGDLRRLVTLNLIDNKLPELPLSMGNLKQIENCVIDGNPINDDMLWKKYSMSSQHLIDYLDKKLFERDQLAKKEAKHGLDGKKKKTKRPKIPIGDSLSSSTSENPSTKDITSTNKIEEKRIDDLSDLSPEERAARKRFKTLEFCHTIKKNLVDFKRAIMLAKTIEEAVPPSKVIRDIKIILEDAKKYLPYSDPPHPAQIFPNDTQLQKLKKTVMIAMKDVEITVMKLLNILATLISESTVETLHDILKDVDMYMLDYPLHKV